MKNLLASLLIASSSWISLFVSCSISLKDTFGRQVGYEVVGEPVDLRGAEELARQDPYQFQWWALGLVGARPAKSEQKKGADKRIDGYIYFHDDPKKKETKEVIIQVKSVHVNVGQIVNLKGVVDREKAQIGVFITLKEPTKPMKVEAVSSGYYKSPLGHNYPSVKSLWYRVEDAASYRCLNIQ